MGRGLHPEHPKHGVGGARAGGPRTGPSPPHEAGGALGGAAAAPFPAGASPSPQPVSCLRLLLFSGGGWGRSERPPRRGPVGGHSPARAPATPSTRARRRRRAPAGQRPQKRPQERPPSLRPEPPGRAAGRGAGAEPAGAGRSQAGSGRRGFTPGVIARPPARPRHPPPGPARWQRRPGQEPAQFLQRLRLPLQLRRGRGGDPVPPHPGGTPCSPNVVRPQADLQLAQDLGRLLHPPPELLGAERG